MMFCIKCGARLKDNSNFCSNCGANQSPPSKTDEYECPRCHENVSKSAKCCPYCHMLLIFGNDKPTIYDDILTNEEKLETPEDVIKETDSLDDSTMAHHDYVVGFFFVIEKMLTSFSGVFVILIVLFFVVGPLAALPLLIFKDPEIRFMIIAFLVAAPFIGAYTYRTGKCPYCGEDLSGIPQSNGLTCKTCEKRILVKDDRFHKIK